jgi:hypothetical protein
VQSSVDWLRWQFGVVHGLLDDPSERATPTSTARYAQLVFLEDLTVSTVLAGGTPLALSTWHGRTGLSCLPPLKRRRSQQAWADSVAIDVSELRSYAQAVYAATDAYLTGFAAAQDRLPLCVVIALLLSLLSENLTFYH